MVSDALILCFYFISLVDVSQINGKAVCSRKYDMYWSRFYPIIHVHLFIISGYLLPPPPPSNVSTLYVKNADFCNIL